MAASTSLTQEQKQEIVALYKSSKYSIAKIADKYNVSKKVVWRIIENNRLKEREQIQTGYKEEVESRRKDFSTKRKETTTNLIEAMADYAVVCGLEDVEVVNRLFKCGLTMADFVLCGYGKFARDCLGFND